MISHLASHKGVQSVFASSWEFLSEILEREDFILDNFIDEDGGQLCVRCGKVVPENFDAMAEHLVVQHGDEIFEEFRNTGEIDDVFYDFIENKMMKYVE
jgi:hypothetical protein